MDELRSLDDVRDDDMSDDEPFGYERDDDAPEDPDPLLPPMLSLVEGEPSAPMGTEPGRQIPHRYRRSLSASVLAAGMLGLRDVLEEPKDHRPVVEQHAADGDVDRAVEVDLDPENPAASVVRLRALQPPEA